MASSSNPPPAEGNISDGTDRALSRDDYERVYYAIYRILDGHRSDEPRDFAQIKPYIRRLAELKPYNFDAELPAQTYQRQREDYPKLKRLEADVQDHMNFLEEMVTSEAWNRPLPSQLLAAARSQRSQPGYGMPAAGPSAELQYNPQQMTSAVFSQPQYQQQMASAESGFSRYGGQQMAAAGPILPRNQQQLMALQQPYDAPPMDQQDGYQPAFSPMPVGDYQPAPSPPPQGHLMRSARFYGDKSDGPNRREMADARDAYDRGCFRDATTGCCEVCLRRHMVDECNAGQDGTLCANCIGFQFLTNGWDANGIFLYQDFDNEEEEGY